MIRSQQLIDRYSKLEIETDSLGRTFKVGMITPSKRNKIVEMTESGSGYVILSLLRAASVRAVVGDDGQEILIPFPRTRQELDANIDMFDTEGLEAISRAMSRLDPPKDDGEASDEAQEAKN